MTDPKGLMGAISDLARAELGNSVEALILSVAELWLLPPPSPSVVIVYLTQGNSQGHDSPQFVDSRKSVPKGGTSSCPCSYQKSAHFGTPRRALLDGRGYRSSSSSASRLPYFN